MSAIKARRGEGDPAAPVGPAATDALGDAARDGVGGRSPALDVGVWAVAQAVTITATITKPSLTRIDPTPWPRHPTAPDGA